MLALNVGRKTGAKLNLGETSDDFEGGLSFDEGEQKPSKVINKEYKKAPPAQPLKLFSGDQNLITKPHSNVERIVGGASRQWESNVLEPITFPLKSVNQAQPKPLYESQSSPLVYGSKTPVPPRYGKITTGIQKVKPKPVLPSNFAFFPPSFESVVPSSGVGENVAGSTSQQGNLDSTQGVYSTNSVSPVSPTPEDEDDDQISNQESNLIESAGKAPIQKQISWISPAVSIPLQSESWRTPEWFGQSNEIDGSTNFAQPTFARWPLPIQSSFTGFYWPMMGPLGRSLPAKATDPLKVLLPPKGFVMHSKNRYQRRRIQKSKLTYTPNYQMSKGKPGKGGQNSHPSNV